MALGHGGDDVLDLGGGEGAADTAARAAAEGEVGERRAGRARLGPEAVGIEALGCLPHARMAVGDVGAQQDQRPDGDSVAAELVILHGRSRGEPGGRVEAQDLLDHAPGVAEAREIVGAGGAAGEDIAAFLLDLPSGLRMLGQRVPGPGERAGRGRMPGDEEGLQLVVELGVAQGIEEGSEQRTGR